MSDHEVDTSFTMKITDETAEWLEKAFPDQLGTQEKVRAALAESRRRRIEAELFVENREPEDLDTPSTGD
jgi:hypothetical protein